MKEFNLEDFNSGEYDVVTRDGRKVLKVIDTGMDITYTLVAIIEGENSSESYTKNGTVYERNEVKSDLFLVPKELINEYYCNVYRTRVGNPYHPDIEVAIRLAGADAINVIKITISSVRGIIATEVVHTY